MLVNSNLATVKIWRLLLGLKQARELIDWLRIDWDTKISMWYDIGKRSLELCIDAWTDSIKG